MYIDFKITTWERVKIPSEKEKEVIERIKSIELESSSDLFDFIKDFDGEYEILDDTSVQMTLKQNSSEPTIEVFMEEGSEPDWDNGINRKK
jgi:hypothetical protein